MTSSICYIRFRKPPPTTCHLNQPFTVVWDIESDLGDHAYEYPVSLTCETTTKDIRVRLLPLEKKQQQQQQVASTWDYVPYRGGGIVTRLMLVADDVGRVHKTKKRQRAASAQVQLVFSLAPASRAASHADHPLWAHSHCSIHDDWVIGLATMPISLSLSETTDKTSASEHQVQRMIKTGPENDARLLWISEDNEQTIARHVWDCGLALSAFLERNQGTIKPKHVIELGSGTGLAGIYAAHVLHPLSVTLTDLPNAMPILRQNVGLNACKGTDIQVHVLSWGAQANASEYDEDGADDATLTRWDDEDATRYDLILLADVLYNQGSHDILLDTLNWLLAGPDAKVLLAYKERNPDERSFFTKVGARHWKCTRIEEQDDPSVFEFYWISKKHI
ncbi:putative methyltransferase-domain-containing protein, partial [Gongronella butleri]